MVGESEGQPTDDICPRFRSSSVIPNQYTPSPALFPFPGPPPPPPQKNTRPIVLFSSSICKRYPLSPPPPLAFRRILLNSTF